MYSYLYYNQKLTIFSTWKIYFYFGYRDVETLKFDIMARNYVEDRMNDLYESVADGNLENYYALEDYLNENGFREGFYGFAYEYLG